jgi:hypothetical protein
VKHVCAVEDGETKVGFLRAPLHRSTHALFVVIPERSSPPSKAGE